MLQGAAAAFQRAGSLQRVLKMHRAKLVLIIKSTSIFTYYSKNTITMRGLYLKQSKMSGLSFERNLLNTHSALLSRVFRKSFRCF